MKNHLANGAASAALLVLTTPAIADGYLSIFGGWSDPNFDISSSTQNRTTKSFTRFAYHYTDYSQTKHLGTILDTLNHSAFGRTGFYQSIDVFLLRIGSGQTIIENSQQTKLNANDGYVIGAAIGTELLGSVRGEIELSWRNNRVDFDRNEKTFWDSSWTGGFFIATLTYYHITETNHTSASPWQCPSLSQQSDTCRFFYYSTRNTLPTWVFFPSSPFVTKIGFSGEGSGSQIIEDDGTIKSFSIMANAWFDLEEVGRMTPYLGGGLGASKVTAKIGDTSSETIGLAYQVGVGGYITFSEQSHISLELRYFNGPMPSLSIFGINKDTDYELNEVHVGFRRDF